MPIFNCTINSVYKLGKKVTLSIGFPIEGANNSQITAYCKIPISSDFYNDNYSVLHPKSHVMFEYSSEWKAPNKHENYKFYRVSGLLDAPIYNQNKFIVKGYLTKEPTYQEFYGKNNGLITFTFRQPSDGQKFGCFFFKQDIEGWNKITTDKPYKLFLMPRVLCEYDNRGVKTIKNDRHIWEQTFRMEVMDIEEITEEELDQDKPDSLINLSEKDLPGNELDDLKDLLMDPNLEKELEKNYGVKFNDNSVKLDEKKKKFEEIINVLEGKESTPPQKEISPEKKPEESPSFKYCPTSTPFKCPPNHLDRDFTLSLLDRLPSKHDDIKKDIIIMILNSILRK